MSARTARLLVVVPSDTDPPARLGKWLHDAGLELDVRRLDAGDALPADLSGHDGLLVLGGPQSAVDPDEVNGLAGVRALLGLALAADVPTLAVCLGAQLLVQAGGGQVQRCDDGPEVGAGLVAKRDAAETDPLFGPVPLSPDVLQWHHDEIGRLPAGATLLAGNPHSEIQAFRIGRRVYGLQFHIETTPEMVAAWAEDDPVGVAASPFDAGTLAERAAAVDADLAEVWGPFAARFAELVQGRRPAAGLTLV